MSRSVKLRILIILLVLLLSVVAVQAGTEACTWCRPRLAMDIFVKPVDNVISANMWQPADFVTCATHSDSRTQALQRAIAICVNDYGGTPF